MDLIWNIQNYIGKLYKDCVAERTYGQGTTAFPFWFSTIDLIFEKSDLYSIIAFDLKFLKTNIFCR